VADVIVLGTPEGERLISPSPDDPRLDTTSFTTNCNEFLTQALNGQPKVNTVRNGDRLFDIVSLPIHLSDDIVGAVSFGTENTIAREFNQLTRSELVLGGGWTDHGFDGNAARMAAVAGGAIRANDRHRRFREPESHRRKSRSATIISSASPGSSANGTAGTSSVTSFSPRMKNNCRSCARRSR